MFPACEDKGNTHAQEGNRGQTPIRLLGSEDKAVALGTEGLGCPSEHLVREATKGAQLWDNTLRPSSQRTGPGEGQGQRVACTLLQ